MKIPVKIRLYAGFGALFVLSAFIGCSTYYAVNMHEKNSRSLSHIFDVMNDINQIHYLLSDMASNQRVLRSTNEPLYRDQYYKVKDRISVTMQETYRLVSPDPLLNAKVGALNGQINDLIFFWSQLRSDGTKYDSKEIAAISLDEQKKIQEINQLTESIAAIAKVNLEKGRIENEQTLMKLSWASPLGSIIIQIFIVALIGLVILELKKRKKAEADLQKIIIREKLINEMKARFVSMASHEFRTPLSTILASSQLASKYVTEDDQPKREKHFNRIATAVHHLNEILEDLLSIEKLEIGKLKANQEEFNIEDYVNALIKQIEPLLKNGQQLVYEHKGNPKVMLDHALLRHILNNLVSNAIKFSKENDPIHIRSYNHFDGLMIAVKDQGIGIPKQEQANLFDRFHRATNAQNIEGTGLGLYIAEKYTKVMNGKIKCTSTEGAGTEFTLLFPQPVKEHKAA